MPNDDSPSPFPCPLCTDCDHDIRSGLLDLTTNIMDNFKAATEKLLDACEAEGTGAEEFIDAMSQYSKVQHQIAVLNEVVPDLATIKVHNL